IFLKNENSITTVCKAVVRLGVTDTIDEGTIT
ncbi:MAG: hypothetical protein RI960_12, partial [Pseudomonadota bacterium]